MAGPVINPRLPIPPRGPIPPGRLAGLLRRRVLFHLNTEMFVGAYQRVVVVVRMPGVTFDDLDFDVPNGDGSTVSMSRDARFEPRRPTIMLLAGDVPGDYELVATVRATGQVVGGVKFRVVNEWGDPDSSPNYWFAGESELPAPQPTWGGGDPNGPQNVPTTPKNGRKNVVVVLVDTNDQQWSTTGTVIGDAQRDWADNVANGVLGADGVSRSAADYYREVSYFDGVSGMDIVANVLTTVVHLPNGWTTYFVRDSNNKWKAVSTFCRTVMTTAGIASFAGADMVVCVVQPVVGPPANIAWAYGGFTASGSAGGVTVNARGVVMSSTWGDGSALDEGAGRTKFETLTHELGHTLDLPDAYSPVVANRNVGVVSTNTSWDPMDWEDPWPHFTAAHRLMLGWIKPQWVKTYNFQALGALVDEEVVLTPAEEGAPFPNAYIAIEIRVGDGHNYYFEYRRREIGDIGDELLTPDSRIVGIDVAAKSSTRPDILLLEKHTDDDGAVLAVGQKYHEIDATTPTYPVDFRLEVVSMQADMARVRVRYEVVGKPDPTIRPWPRDAAHPWQSPDIEVSNLKSQLNPAFANVPWNGHPNTVTGRIANHGTASAPGVVAKFYWKDYTVGGAPETLIGTDTHDIAPGATIDFSVNWVPVAPADPNRAQHYCIIVRIDPYSTPTAPPVSELTPLNNEAQSNYARFISASASPPSRQISQVAVGNPFKRPTWFYLRAGQSRPAFRTYLEHFALTLQPGEIRQVTTMFEYAPDLDQDNRPDHDDRKGHVKPNHLSVVGLIHDPEDPLLHGPMTLTGVNAEVAYGRATRIDDGVKVDGEQVIGRVVTLDDGNGVPAGHVIVVSTAEDGREPEYRPTKIQQDGWFRVRLDKRPAAVEAHFVPPDGYGECDSRWPI